MTATHFLSTARLRSTRGAALAAITPLLLTNDPNRDAGHAHRLVWLLFQEGPETRDYLWRDEGGDTYRILSPRPPTDPNGLFDLDIQPFAPELHLGSRLRFSLRAVPTVATKRVLDPSAIGAGARPRGQRVDIVMEALRAVPKKDRGSARDAIVTEVGTRWLEAQGAKAGFRVLPEPGLVVHSPAQAAVAKPAGRQGTGKNKGKTQPRPSGRPPGSVLDFTGAIEVTDPDALLARLTAGFGSAKASGNGLLLISRE